MTIYSIYKATNLLTKKVYIGFDSDWPKRKKNHLHKFKKTNTKFYSSICKHGWKSFVWEVIYQSKDGHHCLTVMEPYFIKEYNSLNEGYNMTFGGEAVMLNRKHSKETKLKMSVSKKGKKPTKEHLEKQKNNLNFFYNNNGSRIEKKCPICNKLYITLKFQNKITCGKSCAATHRNKQRKLIKIQ